MLRNHPNSPIVLLTDFGSSDPYVGIMKGVIQTIHPGVPTIDLLHEVRQGDIRRGAITLHQSRPYFPPGTVFIVVIDPGVGTRRSVIILEDSDQYFVGPDNGVFSYIATDASRYWRANNPDYYLSDVSSTFHGRDIFAPLGAHIAAGVGLQIIGEPTETIVRLPHPRLEISSGEIHGEVLYADHFGNLITSLGKFHPAAQPSAWELRPWLTGEGQASTFDLSQWGLRLPAGGTLRWVKTFGELDEGDCGYLIGSTGLIEIVANNQNAYKLLNVNPADHISLSRL